MRAYPDGMAQALIVDARPELVARIAAALDRSGIQVFTATSSAGAVRLATEPGLSVALVDLELPPIGGRPLLEAMLTAAPTLRVIAMSNATGPDAVVGALERGAADHVAKPVSIAELAARVRAQVRSTARAA